MRALVLQHDEDVPLGHLGEWLDGRQAEVEISRAWERTDGDVPALDGHDLLIVLGSRQAAHDDSLPWLAGELELIRAAHARSMPTLGICFGAQATARALGGEAHRAPTLERAWLSLDTRAPADISAGPWLCWHYDTFALPPDAELLARSAEYPHAFQLGRTIAVQFHPEVTPAIVDGWLEWSGGDGAEELREATAREADANRERALALFDRLWGRVRGA